MKKIYLLIITFLLVPTIVFALPEASINTSAEQIEKGSSVSVNVTLTDVAAWNIQINGTGAATCNLSEADVTPNAKNTVKEFSTICTSIEEGTIDFTVTGDITSSTGETKDISLSKTVIVGKAKSSVNTLSDLKINGKTIPGFSSSNTTYNLEDKYEKSINISAVATDSNATVTGTGIKTLTNNLNTFNIVVKAENGLEKTYTININRTNNEEKTDNKSSNNGLSSLVIDNGKLEFNEDQTEYVVVVENSVNNITITATPSDEKATISGVGTFELHDYVNEFVIEVKAENNEIKKYVVKVARKDKDGDSGIIGDNTESKKTQKTNNNSNNNAWLIITFIVLILFVISMILCLLKAKNNSEKK